MFCSSCGAPMQINFKFCSSCGVEKGEENKNVTSTKPKAKEMVGESRNGRAMTSFQSFMNKKHEERASHFRPSKKPRVASKQEVTINIGVMELNGNEEAIPLRGKSLPLKIAKDVDYDTLLESALKKRGDYDKTFDCERSYKLAYPDGQSAQTIPGAVHRFTLEKYKEGLGKSYGRITLYLCPCLPLSTTEEFSSESDCDGKTESSGSIDFPLGISTERPAETIEIIDDADGQNPPTMLHRNSEDPFYSTDFLPIGISENDAIEEAIRQSIEQHSANVEQVEDEKPELTEAELVTKVKAHSQKVVHGDSKAIVVSRLNLWKTAIPYFKRDGFLKNSGLIRVTFATFTEEEDAVDLGGPRREFFHLLLVAICKDSGMLTNTPEGFIVRCNIKSLQNHDYLTIGQMLSTIIAQGGERPCLFTKSVCDYISMGLDSSMPGIEEIPDYAIKDDLNKLSNANTNEELQSVLNGCEWRFDIDGLPTSISLEDKENFIMQVTKYFVIIKCKPMLDQLVEGLKFLKVFDLIFGNKDMTHFLLMKITTPLTAKQVVRILRPQFSPTGSNRRAQEEVVMTKFVEFLGLCEDNSLLQRMEEDGLELTLEQKKFIPMVTPTHILMFATGACGIPAIGFDPPPSCCFVHDETKAIPCAQTCSNMLYLYVNNKTVEGDCLDYFVTALMNGGIFSKL